VILQGILAGDEEQLIMPTLVIVAGDVEDDVHQVADVPDTRGVMMQIDDSGSLMGQHGLMERVIRSGGVGDVGTDVLVVDGVLGIWITEGSLGTCLGRALKRVAGTSGCSAALLGDGGRLGLSLLGSIKGGVAVGLDFLRGELLALRGSTIWEGVWDPAMDAGVEQAAARRERRRARPEALPGRRTRRSLNGARWRCLNGALGQRKGERDRIPNS
jgi:hypothetical protein